ncbi:MAG: cephalosporin hydroxylase family protein [Candidatus Niyogibacteria bacterium]|nr:cephalosporin hydroxylase family protein [Candidatus Niyogibacteria bacterium]
MHQQDPLEQFRYEIKKRANTYRDKKALQRALRVLHGELIKAKYPYNLFWLGMPIIQTPTEIHAFQEIVWEVKPDCIIETGIAWGGSILLSASLLALLEMCGAIDRGDVIGIDIDIRPHNKKAILAHPLSKKMTMLEGSSTNNEIIKKVVGMIKNKKRVLVRLDSDHTHDHVLAELRAYAPLVSVGSYCVVEDTGIEDQPRGTVLNRPWGKGNNPRTAVKEFLREDKRFISDTEISDRLLVASCPDGFLKRIA